MVIKISIKRYWDASITSVKVIAVVLQLLAIFWRFFTFTHYLFINADSKQWKIFIAQ
ncbi:hypothetical protein [Psychromonas ingrahamii]|uniref:hypothetical protein n=1 Tax=Psychromonas ingrahamii TaxID=357794 RepID=UPI00031190B8|nr:hypothetical protein [Psychromonas ingrahamii]